MGHPSLWSDDDINLFSDIIYNECKDADCDVCPHKFEVDMRTCKAEVLQDLWRRWRTALEINESTYELWRRLTMYKDSDEDFAVGDKVILSGSLIDDKVATVERITKSGLVIVNGMQFYSNGTQRGGDTWYKYYIRHATAEAEANILKDKTIRTALKLMRSKYNITYCQATEIIKILSPESQK